MYLNADWKVLTVGDGDLSFSQSLLNFYSSCHLVPSVYDSLAELERKYGREHYDHLISSGCDVFTGFDVTCQRSWGEVPRNAFDAVIFQFPLVPGFRSREEYLNKGGDVGINLLNRRLLRQFLLHCYKHFLNPNGARLAIITSKDVKPYREWNLEYSLAHDTPMHYLGAVPFDAEAFPGYRVRNVDRDKHVKDTRGISYYWSPDKDHPISDRLKKPDYLTHACQAGAYCALCRTGPFASDKDAQEHWASKRHRHLQKFEDDWSDDCGFIHPSDQTEPVPYSAS